ncbi:hypothetical protein G6024_14515 [Dietzia maris]|nr:hypothetical protein [Dietzia maris]MBB0998283.1 hypothetical protein [Dietzia maris]
MKMLAEAINEVQKREGADAAYVFGMQALNDMERDNRKSVSGSWVGLLVLLVGIALYLEIVGVW